MVWITLHQKNKNLLVFQHDLLKLKGIFFRSLIGWNLLFNWLCRLRSRYGFCLLQTLCRSFWGIIFWHCKHLSFTLLHESFTYIHIILQIVKFVLLIPCVDLFKNNISDSIVAFFVIRVGFKKRWIGLDDFIITHHFAECFSWNKCFDFSCSNPIL